MARKSKVKLGKGGAKAPSKPRSYGRPTKLESHTRPPFVRLGKLGEKRVLKVQPLDRVAFVGMGMTDIQFNMENAYRGGWKKHKTRDQIWAINAAAYSCRCDLAWSIHDKTNMEAIWQEYAMKQPNLEVTWMKDLPCPVVLAEALKEIPNSLEYPLAEIFEYFQESFFTNGLPFLIAYAIWCMEQTPGSAKELYFYGCDYNYLGLDDKSEDGKDCTSYWIGQARARGFKVYLPPQTQLLSVNQRRAFGIYGYFMQPLHDEETNRITEFVNPNTFREDQSAIAAFRKKLEKKGIPVEGDNYRGMLKFLQDMTGLSSMEILGLCGGQFKVMPKEPEISARAFLEAKRRK